jgi:N-methylhydantoinase A
LQGVTVRSLDVRYSGQGYELNILINAAPKNSSGKSRVAADVQARFHAAHARRYGYSDEKRPVEIVNVRVRAVAAAEPVTLPKRRVKPGTAEQAIVKRHQVIFNGGALRAAFYDRALLRAGDKFAGPCVVAEYSATTVVPPQWTARVDAYENMILEGK